MNKRKLRELLDAYGGQSPIYAHIVDQMLSMCDLGLGELISAATSDDGFKALAALNLLPLCYGKDGISAVQIVADMWDGIGAIHARQMVEIYQKEAPELAEVSSSAPVTGRA